MKTELKLITQFFSDQNIDGCQVLSEYTSGWSLDESDVANMPEVDEDTIQSFVNVNQTPTKVSEYFQLLGNFVFLTEEEHRTHAMGDGSWLKKKFPESRGLMSFTRVGFGRGNTQALIGAHFTYGFSASGGSLCLYNFDGDAWQRGDSSWGYTT